MGLSSNSVLGQSSHFVVMLIFYAFLACFVLLSLMIKHKKKSQEAKMPLPGPRRLPLFGNLHQLRNPLHRSLQKLANEHGALMFLQLGSVPTLVISSADMAREIFKTHDLVFSNRPTLYVAKKLSYNCSSISFAPYGEHWKEIRKIAIFELLSAKRVQTFQVVRDEEVTIMLDSIANSLLVPVNLSQLMHELSNSFLCRVAFGKKYDGGYSGKRSVQDMLHEVQDLLGGICIADFFPWMKWVNKFNGLDARLEKSFRELDMLYDKVIEEHLDPKRPKPEHEFLVDVLLRVQKDPSQAIALSNDSIKGVLTDMFIGGSDTSSAAIIWTMTELIRNPLVMKRAQEEVRTVVKGKDRVEESDLSQLVYLKLVVKEALRLHPPAPLLIPRETTEDCKIRGYKIPAKTRVFINATSISLDPKSWENPCEFQPERFLNSSIDFKGQHFELIPFGIGRRGCPGINFAVSLFEITLANLLHRFNWELPPGLTREDLDMEEAFGITMHKKTHLCLVASPVKV